MEKIGLVGATAIGLGAIIGAGIFVLSGVAINLSGTGAILAFLLTGLVAILVAFEVGELSSRMPNEKGASYSFTYNTFGSELGFITGILRLLSFVAAIAAISVGFGSYLTSFLNLNPIFSPLFSIILILILGYITNKGVRKAAKTDTILVTFKVLVLIIFVVFGIYAGKASNFNILDIFSTSNLGGIFAASVLSMFAYAGFQSIASITPFVKGGGKTVAKAILLSVLISAFLYIGVTVAMLMLAPKSAYAFSGDPLSIALNAVHAPEVLTVLIDIAAMVATASATLAMLVGCEMLIFQMSEDGLLPSILKKDKNSKNPEKNSLITTMLLGISFIFAGNIYIIAAISNFGTIFSYLINSVAIIKIRTLEKSGKHKLLLKSMHMKKFGLFLTPLCPYVPILASFLLLIFFIGFPAEALAGGVITILLSILVYYMLEQIKEKPIIRVKIFN
ncbi:MAG: APC family permease [Candidatus Micrarchaeaceae archaeon]